MALEQVKGPLLDSYENIEIFSGFPYNLYFANEPKFSPIEKQLVELLSKMLVSGQLPSLPDKIFTTKEFQEFFELFKKNVCQIADLNDLTQRFADSKVNLEIRENFLKLLKGNSVAKNPKILMESVLSNTIGFKNLGFLAEDNNLEEIMINGFNLPVFVLHKRHGICKTNILVESRGFAGELVQKIALTVGKKFDDQNPLLDARLPDGSRVNATVQQITPGGLTLTIRKFGKIPLSIVNLIESETISSDLAAFLWVMVEGLNIEPMNIIVTGSTSSGKTTLLNILSSFIRYTDRIITIEDTLELALSNRENWIQMEARPKIGQNTEVSMNDLLKNSLRMRPDRIIVGEVRGEEAQTLFVGMDIGHRGCMGTLHSNTAREMLLRLKSAPMNVAEAMLPLLNLIVVMQRFYEPEKGIVRRIKEVAEISRMDETVLLANLFEYDRAKGQIIKTDLPSHIIEVLAERASISKNDLKQEITIRKKILEWMLAQGIKSSMEVEGIIQKYYLDPEYILEKVSKGKN